MTIQANQPPMQNDKVQLILQGLSQGKDRDQLANEAGNQNWKSIDMYMRRKGFTWDGVKKTYVPKVEPRDDPLTADSSKAGKIVAQFRQDNADAKAIAKSMQFSDHREMADYMQVKGYEWDNDTENYVKRIVDRSSSKTEDVGTREEIAGESSEEGETVTAMNGDNLQRFIPLLEFLEENDQELQALLASRSSTGKLPRFGVPGVAKTKTIQMMNTLERLMIDFSHQKNISQRDLVEVALIEFFQKYGYEQQIERLLRS